MHGMLYDALGSDVPMYSFSIFFPLILVAVSIIVVIFSLNHANIVWNYCAERVMDYWF
jgi:hypothetical protein